MIKKIFFCGLTASMGILSFLLLIRCATDAPVSPYDEDYKGDYRITTGSLPTELFAFIPYRLYYRQGNKDKYEKIAAWSQPAGLLDSVGFIYGLSADSMSIYFTRPGSGKICIEGLRHNGKRDTVYYNVNVKNPFFISVPAITLASRPAACTLKTVMGAESAIKQLKNVTWNVLPKGVEKILPASEVFVAPGADSTFFVAASCEDSRGNRFRVDSVAVTVTSERPVIELFKPLKESFAPADTLGFQLKITSSVSDRCSLVVASKSDTVRSTVVFKDSKDTTVIIRFTKGLPADTGQFSATAVAINSNGFASEESKANYKVVAMLPVLSLAPGTDTIIAGVGMEIKITVIGNAAKYVWTFSNSNGVSDTTTTPTLTRVVFTDSGAPVSLDVYGLDNYGFKGNTVRIVLKPLRFFYSVRFDVTPAPQLQPRDTLKWKVSVTDISGKSVSSGTMRWTLINAKGDTLRDTTKSNLFQIALVVADTGVFTMKALFTEQANKSSPIIANSVILRWVRPKVVIKKAPSQIYAKTNACVTFSASDSAGKVNKVIMRCEGADTTEVQGSGTDTVLCVTPKKEGSFNLLLWAIDSDNNMSDIVKSGLTVVLGKPKVDSITYTEATIYRGRQLRFEARVSAIAAKVEKYVWIFGTDTLRADSSAIYYAFNSTGVQNVKVYCIDARGIESEIYSMPVTVNEGMPTVSDILASSNVIYRSCPVTLTVVATSPSGITIQSYKWKIGGIDTTTTRNTIEWSFKDAGKREVEVSCIGTMGFASDVYKKEFTISSGVPEVKSISLPGSIVYGGTPFSITVEGSDDPCGTIDTFEVVLVRGTTDTSKFKSAQKNVNCQLAVGTDAAITVLARVRDNLGQWSASKKAESALSCKAGEPSITSVRQIDTSWINDDISFAIAVNDPNGKVDTIIVDWADGSKERLFNSINAGTVTILASHKWTTSAVYNVVIQAKDNHGLLSAPLTHQVRIKEGRPRIRLVSGRRTEYRNDTVYTASDSCSSWWGMSFFYINAVGTDSNGSIIQYNFYDTIPYNPNSPAATGGAHGEIKCPYIYSRYRGYYYSDTGATPVVVSCIDDDGFVAADTFFLCFDQPPYYPNITSPQWGDTLRSRTVTLRWHWWEPSSDRKVFNYPDRDRLDTKLQIVIASQYNSSTYSYTQYDTVQTFKLSDVRGTVPSHRDTLSRTFTIPNNIYNYQRLQIQLKVSDKLGQNSINYNNYYFNF